MDCLDAPSHLHQATVPPVPDLLENGTGSSRNILQMVSRLEYLELKLLFGNPSCPIFTVSHGMEC